MGYLVQPPLEMGLESGRNTANTRLFISNDGMKTRTSSCLTLKAGLSSGLGALAEVYNRDNDWLGVYLGGFCTVNTVC